MKAALFAITLSLLSCGDAAAEVISGPAKATDGDSLNLAGVHIRLFGIDAPERRQTCNRDGTVWQCGEDAAVLLQSLIVDHDVLCERRDTDAYGRMVAVCMVDGLDVAQAVIEAGMAVALPQFTEAYVDKEMRARSIKLGLWASEFQMPADYRVAHFRSAQASSRGPTSMPVPTTATHKGGCTIKGNRNRKGQWIYHLPGMPYYGQTRAEEIFCTEAQARAAGYRRAIVK